ncbi:MULTISPECIES: M10 family metallopeptidase C-terminal domain-containing protein [unclassified Pseudomonas]|uniref:M10 family metallopeptidase C-terminal domain-containing protein n=1 Tax=unclassified Pseudomonas TaxID=196821 RepID=UPI000C88DE7E|nr:hypothetical protein C1X61_19825 [Pseudomonas sp. FW215-T2]PNA13458.1 hypothetical protein C1X62_09760 [Pseudomonas sp. FW215-R3]PNB38134.1 hypothetical protein C1X63_09220 [Pseudomonas sp. FW305-131]
MLVGGTGKDVLTGGAGNDIFDFNAVAETVLTSSTWDIISDFVRGADKIDLSTLDANMATWRRPPMKPSARSSAVPLPSVRPAS